MARVKIFTQLLKKGINSKNIPRLGFFFLQNAKLSRVVSKDKQSDYEDKC